MRTSRHGSPLVGPHVFSGWNPVVQMNLICGFGWDRHIQLRKMMGLTHWFEATTLRSEKTEHVLLSKCDPTRTGILAVVLIMFQSHLPKHKLLKVEFRGHAWVPNSTNEHPKLNFSSATWMPPSSVLLSTCTILRPTNVLKNPDQYRSIVKVDMGSRFNSSELSICLTRNRPRIQIQVI